ncbi:hypothetical protein GO730_04085 [Spirosoma sp. HMF3257]|uniref:Ig-like domain-containing protein n=1 Tax=Spirosoma telluris TaxID=2183553 RepID=A0A327NHI1_9BACT|nr:hypothetical protein [Spirosoma telluris]RAI73779.1 hypothetical protein HMF3257_04025 [Spirosoma telluris]
MISSTSIVSGLAPGLYTVVITDSKGCTATRSVPVGSTSGLSLGVSSTSTTCGQVNGTAHVNVSGGSGNYSYSWTNSAGSVVSTGADLVNVGTGVYTLQVSDGSSGCSSMTTVVIGGSSPVQLTTQVQNASCGGSTGSASVTASGGSGSYSYQWKNGSGVVVSTTSSLVNAVSGSYTVVVTDSNGCSNTVVVTINNTTGPQVSGTVTNVLCNGSGSGSVVLTVTGVLHRSATSGATAQRVRI